MTSEYDKNDSLKDIALFRWDNLKENKWNETFPMWVKM